MLSLEAVRAQVHDALRDVLDAILRHGHRIVLVVSPPGAGKTRLVEDVIGTCVHYGMRTGAMTPQADQAYDLIRRLRAGHPNIEVHVLLSKDRELPSDLDNDQSVTVISSDRVGFLPSPSVVVGTVDKFRVCEGDFGPGCFDLLVWDECFQVPYAKSIALLQCAQQVLLVGDPGQLPPLVRVDTARFEAAPYRVHRPLPEELLQHVGGNVARIALPATWRFPQDTVDFVQPAFYPGLPFVSAVRSADRALTLRAGGMGDVVDRALDSVALGHSLVGVVLPAAQVPAGIVDEELAAVAARIIDRASERGLTFINGNALGFDAMGVVDPHRASGASIRRYLSAAAAERVSIATPEVWQGLQRDLMIAVHPLSGLTRFSRFELEAGRWCVSLSRHRAACIFVTRDGVDEALARHQSDLGGYASEAEDFEGRGWEAHDRLWSLLERRGRLVYGA